MTSNACTEELSGGEGVTVGSLTVDTVVVHDGEHYRVSALEAGPWHVELERVEKYGERWIAKRYCADDKNVFIPNKTLVTIV